MAEPTASSMRIPSAFLELETNDAHAVLGDPDDLKLQSSMTLFAQVDPVEDRIFQRLLLTTAHARPGDHFHELLGIWKI